MSWFGMLCRGKLVMEGSRRLQGQAWSQAAEIGAGIQLSYGEDMLCRLEEQPCCCLLGDPPQIRAPSVPSAPQGRALPGPNWRLSSMCQQHPPCPRTWASSSSRRFTAFLLLTGSAAPFPRPQGSCQESPQQPLGLCHLSRTWRHQLRQPPDAGPPMRFCDQAPAW